MGVWGYGSKPVGTSLYPYTHTPTHPHTHTPILPYREVRKMSTFLYGRVPMSLSIASTLLLGACQPVRAARQATFEARNEIAVTVPDQAGRVRVWVALPQEGAAQEVRDLRI